MGDAENIRLFKALGEEARYNIIKVLLEGERCACEIPELIGKTQSNTSMHLAKLQDWNIIKSRKDGINRIYSIKSDKVKELFEIIGE